jgi:hypothetical protein
MGPVLKAHGLKIVLGLIAVYFIFFHNLGTRTFFGHVRRIVTTPEARELAYEVRESVASAAVAVTRKLRGDRPLY